MGEDWSRETLDAVHGLHSRIQEEVGSDLDLVDIDPSSKELVFEDAEGKQFAMDASGTWTEL